MGNHVHRAMLQEGQKSRPKLCADDRQQKLGLQ
jgi:hypothetical protein